jgi:FixJ family two-component response regulator
MVNLRKSLMFNIDNLTVVYLIGLVSLSYGIIQALTLRDEQHSSRIWAIAQIFFAFGFVGLVYFGKDPLTKSWIGCYALVVLGALIQLTAIARFGKNPIPKIPAVSCLIALAAVVFLFESTRELGAPLSSLETLLFTPLLVIYIYMALFSWRMGYIPNSIYLKLTSVAFWAYAVLMALTLILCLFGLGRGLIDVNSPEIGILALASLALSLISNYLWTVQAAELSETNISLINFDIALEAKANAVPIFVTAPGRNMHVNASKSFTKEVKAEPVKNTANSSISGAKSEKTSNAEKANKATPVKQVEANPDRMNIAEQEALLASLTDREKEVFLLAADGMKNGQIAQELNSSESSVKVHRSRMVSKLSMSSVENLAKLKKNLSSIGVLGDPVVEPIKKVVLGSTVQTNIELSKDRVDVAFPDATNSKPVN